MFLHEKAEKLNQDRGVEWVRQMTDKSANEKRGKERYKGDRMWNCGKEKVSEKGFNILTVYPLLLEHLTATRGQSSTGYTHGIAMVFLSL